MTRYIITTNCGDWERGCSVRANSKDEALHIFKTDKAFAIFKNDEIVSVETEDEADCRIIDEE